MNLTERRETTIGIVRIAGVILRNHFERRDFTDKSKGGVDFVTEADEEVDRFLIEALKGAFPGTNFLTEETAKHKDALDNYSKFVSVNDLWVVDPLDGTTNFSRGSENFGISVALVDSGLPKLGVIYMPMSDELFWAQEDVKGAFLNEKRIYVSDTSDLKKTVINTDWPHDLSKRKITVDWQRKLSERVRSIQISGSAVSAMSRLAAGKNDAFLHPGIKPWDVAAASLLVQKAGGQVTRVDNSSWNIFNTDILASNGLMHDQILRLIGITTDGS